MTAGCILTAAADCWRFGLHHVWVLLAVMAPYNLTSTMIWPAVESGLDTLAGGNLR